MFFVGQLPAVFGLLARVVLVGVPLGYGISGVALDLIVGAVLLALLLALCRNGSACLFHWFCALTVDREAN